MIRELSLSAAVLALGAGTALAQSAPSNLLTSLEMSGSWLDSSSPTEGIGFSENFEGFALGGVAGQFGWGGTANSNIVDSGVAGFGDRSLSVAFDGGAGIGLGQSANFGVQFGTIAADIFIAQDTGDTLGFETADIGVGTINTRVLFQPGGAIEVVQVAGGAGVIVGTSGSWSAGSATQIGIEILMGNVLNVYQDGSLIFTGHDIIQELGSGAGGADILQGLSFGPGSGALVMDNITNQLIPAPGAVGLFGLAGLAAARRRR